MNTPWGKADHVESPVRGVHFVSTPSHGGIMVSKELAERVLSDKARSLNVYGGIYNGYYCFEEDCEWALVLYEHPEWEAEEELQKTTVEETKKNAEETIRYYYPTYFTS